MENSAVISVVLFGILFLSAFVGFAKGFLQQAIELAGIVASFIVAIMLAGSLASFLESRLNASYSLALVMSFVALVLLGSIASHWIAVAVGRVVKMTILRMIDRFTGAVLGLIMGMIVASLLITITLELPLASQFRRDVAKSSMALFLRPIAGQLYNWIVAHGSKARQFEDFFKHGKTV
jgi:membrane protein required for colicin V production